MHKNAFGISDKSKGEKLCMVTENGKSAVKMTKIKFLIYYFR